MGFFSKVGKTIAKPFESAGRSIAGNVSDLNNSNLFGEKSSLIRALANPADAVAVGQVLNRTAVQGDSPTEIIRDSDGQVRAVVRKVEYFHNELARTIWDGIYSGWHSFFDQVGRTWSDAGGKSNWNKLGNSIERTVDKWGGEQVVMGWVVVGVVVIIYVLVVVFSWGSLSAPATAGLVAVLGAVGSYGVSAGLGPRKDEIPKEQRSASYVYNADNSNFTAIDGNPGSSSSGSSSGLGLGGMMDGVRNLPPLALAGLAVVGGLGVWFLLKR